MNPAKPYVWIDTDTGVDDALALICACILDRQGKLNLVGVSAVCGNVEVEKTFENARNVLALAGKTDVPVYPGAASPLKRPLETAKHVHGENGLGDAVIPASKAPRLTKPAWDALYEQAKALNGELNLVLIGPQTNAAVAFRKHPDLVRYLKSILVMGGALEGGNCTPYAEFNIFVDPDAAKEVFDLDIPFYMFGLDVTMKAVLVRSDIDAIESGGGAGCRLFKDSTRVAQGFYQRLVGDVYCVHDACPVLYLTNPDLFTGQRRCGIDVVAEENDHLGQTVPRSENENSTANVTAMTDVNREEFARMVHSLLLQV